MRVFKNGKYDIRIHANDHQPPHCHVWLNDGSELVIALATLTELFGKSVSRDLKKVLEDNLEELADK